MLVGVALEPEDVLVRRWDKSRFVLPVVRAATSPDGVEGVGVGPVDDVVLGHVVQPAVVLEGLVTTAPQDVLLEDCPAGAGVAVEQAGQRVEGGPVLDPVVEDMRMAVAVLLQLREVGLVAAPLGAGVDGAKVAGDPAAIVMDVVVLDLEYCTAVSLSTVHGSGHPLENLNNS